MILIALLLQAAAPPPSSSQAPPLIVALPGQPPATMVVEPVAMMIATFDADGDGKTTRIEMEAGVRHSFEAIDTGHAGSLGYIGFADWAERWLGDRNALPSPFEIDTDGDNRITLAELQAQFARIFTRLDRNRDGVVTRAEVLTIREMARGERPSDGKNGRKGKK